MDDHGGVGVQVVEAEGDLPRVRHELVLAERPPLPPELLQQALRGGAHMRE